MKNIFILLVILIILLFFLTCTVNDFTGLIRVENHTETELRNVRIGDTLIIDKVASGDYFDYWISYTLTGKVKTEGVEVNRFQDNLEFKFQPGYWIFITAHIYEEEDGDREQVEISARKQGSEQDEEWIED